MGAGHCLHNLCMNPALAKPGTACVEPWPAWRSGCALQAGDAETGVSVAFTVCAMDAGPVLAQERISVDPNMQAPQLLQDLFDRGTRCGDALTAQQSAGEAGAVLMSVCFGPQAKSCFKRTDDCRSIDCLAEGSAFRALAS